MTEIIAEIVRTALDQKAASRHIKHWSAKNIDKQDRDRFIEVVETEIMSLHEGRLARYRPRPSESRAWLAAWERPARTPPTPTRKSKAGK